ncbi:hypothetical protein OS12_26890 [Dickeya oryzae]
MNWRKKQLVIANTHFANYEKIPYTNQQDPVIGQAVKDNYTALNNALSELIVFISTGKLKEFF